MFPIGHQTHCELSNDETFTNINNTVDISSKHQMIIFTVLLLSTLSPYLLAPLFYNLRLFFHELHLQLIRILLLDQHEIWHFWPFFLVFLLPEYFIHSSKYFKTPLAPMSPSFNSLKPLYWFETNPYPPEIEIFQLFP